MNLVQTRRIFSEKRALILPLAVVLLVNGGVYALVVYPLRTKVAGAEAAAADAAQDRRAAEREQAAVHTTLAGKDQAEKALKKFYRDVLPADMASARRVTSRLAQLARDADLRYERRMLEPEHDRDSQLSKLRMTMVLQGQYENIRRFIYQLETAPHFVVIEDVKLAQGGDTSAPLSLTVALSTYFRTENGPGRSSRISGRNEAWGAQGPGIKNGA